jgi:cysteine desulfuration protein SufE
MNLDELREHFDLLDGWEDRYRYLIDLGKKLAPMPDALKNDRTKVDGCLSQVWMQGDLAEGRMRYLADSDAIIVRGLIAVLMVAYDGKTPADIAATDARGLFDDLGFGAHVSMNRRNGFFSMVSRIQRDAAQALGPSLADLPRTV